jgi:hypothetical protein
VTLQQLSAVKRWHIAHHRQGSVEYQAWDIVIICWVLGWMGVPPALVLAPVVGVLCCGALLLMPPAYVGLRRRLHRRGTLRCDWLGSLPQH